MDIEVLSSADDVVISTISYATDIEVFGLQYRSFRNIGFCNIELEHRKVPILTDVDGQYWDKISWVFGDLRYRISVVPISAYHDKDVVRPTIS